MKRYNIKSIFALLIILFTASCSNLDEELYDRIGKENYYQNKNAILASVLRTYEHGHWYSANERWYAQELTADHFTWTQKGRHGYDGGNWVRLHNHTWTAEENVIASCWNGGFTGIGYANNTIDDIEKLDYSKFSMTDVEKQSQIAELKTIRSWYQLMLLDFFGSIPIVENIYDLKPQSTPQETFTWIEKEIKDNIAKLPKTPVAKYEGRMTQGAAATILVRLYLNAQTYIGTPKWIECAQVCQDILDGKYGTYSIDPKWYGPFNGQNDKSPEAIWYFPHAKNQLDGYFYYAPFFHYNTDQSTGFTQWGEWNGIHMQPSLDLDGNPYTTDLGRPFAKFNDKDLRKKPFKYLGNGKYEGMFFYGPQYKRGTTEPILGTEEYSGKPLIFVDQVGRFSEKPVGRWLEGSHVVTGEENSGVRWMKYPVFPDNDPNEMEPDGAEMRLTEIVYSLAECKFRLNDKAAAATLLNSVRIRNFTAEDWTLLAYTPDQITEQELIDEWGREFLGERRRRTDLIRFNKFTQGTWWDKQPSPANKKLFPIPNKALNTNPLLKPTDANG